MSQLNSDNDDREPTPPALSALFPAAFIERLVEPLFAAPARAEIAEAYLGAPLAHACAGMCRRDQPRRRDAPAIR